MREFDTAVAALRSGVYDFLTKPINPDALLLLISRLVERKNHMMEIENAQRRLVNNERLAAIGQMVAGLAHESRNAFQRSHACLAELSLDVAEMPESLKLVQKVQKALDDVNFLLDEVRQYSAPIKLDRQRCDISKLIQETWQQIRDADPSKTAPAFQINTADDVPPACMVDQTRLIQVMRNLLENASFAAGASGQIIVQLESLPPTSRSNLALQISVTDSGPGVAQEDRDEIFTPFFTTKTKGTGLGLAICRRIVEAHGGDLTLEDSETGGAKFVIRLPLRFGQKKSD